MEDMIETLENYNQIVKNTIHFLMQKNFYKGRKVIVITFENDILLMHG